MLLESVGDPLTGMAGPAVRATVTVGRTNYGLETSDLYLALGNRRGDPNRTTGRRRPTRTMLEIVLGTQGPLPIGPLHTGLRGSILETESRATP